MASARAQHDFKHIRLYKIYICLKVLVHSQMNTKTMKHRVWLPTAVATVAVFSLAAIFPAVIAQDRDDLSQLLGDNKTLTDSTTNITSSTTLIMDNGTLDCQAI